MTNLRPLTTAKINDVDVQFVVDSGAFYSILSPARAAELKLETYPAPYGLFIKGVAGTAKVAIAKVKVFTLAGVPFHNIDFLVGGSEVGAGSVGVLGQNVLHMADVEYDLGQGFVRLMRPEDCGSAAMLGYWIAPSTVYSVIGISSTTARLPQTRALLPSTGLKFA